MAIGAKVRSERDYSDAKAAHLDISDYVLQQEIEYSELAPSEQRQSAKKYQANVKSFIDQKMKDMRSDQARGMLQTPAGQSQLRFKQWSLTQELKAEKAHQTGLMVATGQNLIAQALREILSPSADSVIVDALDAMPSQNGEDTGESTRLLRQDDRSGYQAKLDAYLSNLEDIADQKTTSPQQREAFIRNGTTEFYQGVVNGMLAQDPPRYEQAKKLLEAVPAISLSPKGKAEMLTNIRAIGATQKRKADSDRALSITLKALDDAGLEVSYQPEEGANAFSVNIPSAAERSDAAAEDLERQFRAYIEGKPGISASVYSAARQHLRVETADLVERENREGFEILSEIMEAAPNAMSMEDVPTDLARRAQNNSVALQGLTGRAKVQQGSNLSKTLASDTGFFASNQERKKEAEQLLVNSVTANMREALNSLYLDARMDIRKLTKLVGDDKSVDEGSQIILKKFWALGDKQATEMVNAYRALSVGAAPTDAGFGSLARLAAQIVYGPSKGSKLFGKLTLDTDSNEYVVSSEIDPAMAQFVEDRIKKEWTKGDKSSLPSKPTLTDMISLLQTDQETSRFMFDRETDPDIPIPAYALKAYQKGVEEGRLVVDIGGGRLVGISTFKEPFMVAARLHLGDSLKDVKGFSEDAATYKFIQEAIDERNSSADGSTPFEMRTYATAKDFANLLEDRSRVRRRKGNAEVYLNPTEVDPVVNIALARAKEDVRQGKGVTAEAVSQAVAYVESNAATPEEAIRLKEQVEQLSANLQYSMATDDDPEATISSASVDRALRMTTAMQQKAQTSAVVFYKRLQELRQEMKQDSEAPGQILLDIEKQFGSGPIEGQKIVQDDQGQILRFPNLGVIDSKAAEAAYPELSRDNYDAAKAEAEAEGRKRIAEITAGLVEKTQAAESLERELKVIHISLYGGFARYFAPTALSNQQRKQLSYEEWLKSLEGGK